MRARQIFESPDIISYPDLQYNAYGEPVDENEWSPQFGDEDSHPIWLSDGELVLGKARDAHPLNIRHTKDFYPGRLWKERKMISFWVYPEKDLFFKMMEGLSARLSRYYNENIDILRDPEWKIEILPQKKEAWRGLTYVKERNPEVWHSELIPVKDYEGSAQRSPEDLGQEHVKSPMQKKERDKVGGSKKYGKEKPLPWRQALVPESLEESMEFERGESPKKSMGIGKEALPVYRCGYCGAYTDKDGDILNWKSQIYKDSIELDKRMKGKSAKNTICDLCRNEHEAREEEWLI